MRWQHEWMDAFQGANGTLVSSLRDTRDYERFEIYQASYQANLGRALRDTYPVVNRLVGEDYFGQLARAYLCAYPSRSGDIHEFGGDFATFIAAQDSAKELFYLPDVARLEWLAHQAFHAADAKPLTLSGLAKLPLEACADLCLLPCVRLMHSEFPVHRIWQVNQESWMEDAVVNLEAGGVRLAVYRAGLDIVLLPMQAEAYELACALFKRGSLDAVSGVMRDAESMGRALYTLIDAGLVAMACATRNLTERTER